jgi:hypothetical protein
VLRQLVLTRYAAGLLDRLSAAAVLMNCPVTCTWFDRALCAVCADIADDSALAVTKDAFYFLQENGYINFGVLPGEPLAGRGLWILLTSAAQWPGQASGHRWLATVQTSTAVHLLLHLNPHFHSQLSAQHMCKHTTSWAAYDLALCGSPTCNVPHDCRGRRAGSSSSS